MDQAARRPRGRPRTADTGAEASVQSLDRAVGLLSALAGADGLTLAGVAAATGLPGSTAYRLLSTLQRHGLVEFEEAGQRWHVGVEAFRIGSSFLRRRKIIDRSRQALLDLSLRFGETANLAVADASSVVFVSQVEAHAALRAFFRPGTRAPYHASGAGKAMLAYLPAGRLDQILGPGPLERFTPRTVADRARLGAELDTVRARGWAVDDEERNEGMRCVAAPVFNEFAEPIAGISVSGPTLRLTDTAVAGLGPAVRDAAAAVTALVAGTPPGGPA